MNANSSARLIQQWFDLNDDSGLTQHTKPRRARNLLARWIDDPE